MDKIAKLYALYRFGVGGERDNAEKMLIAALAPKTIAEYEREIDDQFEQKDIVYLRWKTEFEKKLTFQTVVMFFDGLPQGRVWKRSLEIHAGKSKCAVLKYTHKLFMDAWKQELDLFYIAFLSKNSIFAATYKGGSTEKRTIEQELKISQMAAGIDRVNRTPAIEYKSKGKQ